MASRPDPERLYAARRAGFTTRLVNEARLSPKTAERWLIAWEAEAALRSMDRRSDVFWRDSWERIGGGAKGTESGPAPRGS